MPQSDDKPRPFAWVAEGDNADLGRLRSEIFDALSLGASKGSHGFHLPVIATFDAAAGRPASRTVVLRGFDRDVAAIQCHTDARTPKVRELDATPSSSWTFYDRDARVQVVAEGPTTTHTDDEIADAAWEGSRVESLRCYLAPQPPGRPMDRRSYNLPDDLVGQVPTKELAELGRENFAVVRTEIATLDFLLLKREGNIRALFERTAGGWRDGWIAS